MSSKRNHTKILTVGDGDFSLSLALARAYGSCIELTASVLDASREEVLQGYPDAEIEELQALDVEILFGLDATQIHEKFPDRSWDLVCFHHPHLGLASLELNEAEHANRHFQLLCHYLFSAKQVSKSVHVCLCGTQPDTWRLLEASKLCQMTLAKKLSTTVAFCQLWSDEPVEPAQAQPSFAAPRRYRNGRLGSRHMLGKWGYKHRRTEGERYKGLASDMNVTGSMHYLFQSSSTQAAAEEKEKDESTTDLSSRIQCNICQATFLSENDLLIHLKAPAMPNIIPTTIQSDEQKSKMTIRIKQKENAISIPCRTIDQLDRKGSELNVIEQYNGKRLRWYIQHGIQSLSKRQAELAIQQGFVFVNDEKVLDSSRILVTGNTVFVAFDQAADQAKISKSSSSTSSSSSKPDLEIIYRKAPLLVVFKPAGVRTRGQFGDTVEATISQQEGITYSSLSSLDTSCAGLCVLIQTTEERNNNAPLPTILHSMTALVYGNIPDSWMPNRNVTITFEPKWKKKRKYTTTGEDKSSSLQQHKQESVQLFPLKTKTSLEEEKHQDSPSSLLPPSLTTIQIVTKNPCAASLCRFLRQDGYGVVGDIYCRQEYLKLKRSIRNRIKDKLCIGCYQVEIDGLEIKKEIPEKLLANFWLSNF